MSEIALNTLKSVKNYPNTPYLGQNPKFSKKNDFLTGFLMFFVFFNNFPHPLASSGSQKHQKTGAFVEKCLPLR